MQPLYPLKLYLKHLPNAVTLMASALSQLLMWGWLVWHIEHSAEPIFLHYNVLFGVDYIGEWWQLLLLPMTGFFIMLFNAIIGWFFFQQDKFVAQLMNSIALVCQIGIGVAVVLLVFLNV